MDYKDIERVNSEIEMIDMKGKNYAMVPERVTAFRKLFPEGFIITEIIENDGTTVLMKASVGYYRDGDPVVLASGMAQEVRGKGMVNGTSHIENCETSAVGRALGMMGLGINGGGICSAEELVNAITAQGQMKAEKKVEPLPEIRAEAIATVSTAAAVPEASPVKSYLLKAMQELRENRRISAAKNNKLFAEQRDALIAAGLAPDKKLDEYTLEEAAKLIDDMYKRFDPEGTVIK